VHRLLSLQATTAKTVLGSADMVSGKASIAHLYFALQDLDR
jgi:hypothetical protein